MTIASQDVHTLHAEIADLKAKLAASEAGAAAMRVALVEIVPIHVGLEHATGEDACPAANHECFDETPCPIGDQHVLELCDCCLRCTLIARDALATDAGRALLADLEQLKTFKRHAERLVAAVRVRLAKNIPEWPALVDLFARWDAGESIEEKTDPERLRAIESNEVEIRKTLWLGHGHDGPSLYGDDGEMQCSACVPSGCDYRRRPLEVLVATALMALHKDGTRSARIATAARAVIEAQRGTMAYSGPSMVALRALLDEPGSVAQQERK